MCGKAVEGMRSSEHAKSNQAGSSLRSVFVEDRGDRRYRPSQALAGEKIWSVRSSDGVLSMVARR